MFKQLISLFTFLLTSFLFAASAPAAGEPEDQKLYLLIDSKYRIKNYEEVLKQSRTFLQKHPSSHYIDQVYLLRALTQIAQNQFNPAIENLKKALEVTKEGSLKSMLYYNLGFAYFESKEVTKAESSLEAVQASHLSKENRSKFYILRAKVRRNNQAWFQATEDVFRAIENAPDPNNKTLLQPLVSFLGAVLEPIDKLDQLEALLDDFEDSIYADHLLYKIAMHYYTHGNPSTAKNFFEKIVSQFPESKFYTKAFEQTRRLKNHSQVEPKRIGVMLTLSGKFAKFGHKALQGIQLAFKIFQGGGDSDAITLVVVDDQAEVEHGLSVLDELVFKHHVVGIIGPLSSKLAEPAANRAKELNVPLIALTQKEATPNDYVFNAAITPAIQAHELVEYATKKATVKNFALLGPRNAFGSEYVKAFWDAVDEYDGVVRGYERYPEDETDFRFFIDLLVGLHQTEARAREVAELTALKEAAKIKSNSKKFDRLFSLKPVIDFEAVFIPDDPKVLGQILPTFAYRDVENILFLGTNTWNNPELIARGGPFVEGAVFVDGFFSDCKNQICKKFIEDFRNVFGTEPSSVEATAYDAANLVASLIKKNVGSRNSLKEYLSEVQNFPAVTGNISYKSGRFIKKLTLLTVKNGKIIENN